jgi:c-di-GMP-binding flagellar brake protein YcgR
MFDKLKSLFSKHEENTQTTTENDDELSPFENPNFITDLDKINTLLTEIETSSPLCTVNIDGVDTEYSTSILGIKVDKNLIILDELIPKEGNDELQNKKSLKLSTFHKGIHLSFNLSDIETGSSRGIEYYKASLPEKIFYPQRRRSPRIEISSIDIPFSGVSERTGISVSGYLFDLSRGGAGIDMPINRARVQRGDVIKNCKISFEDYVMDFDFSVRFVKPVSINSSKIQIGGFFENLSSKSQSKLSYFITSLERVEIRKQKA